MRLLLDTHVLVWHYESDSRLSDTAKNAIHDNRYPVVISAVSIWEMCIKVNLGKLPLRAPVDRLVFDYRSLGVTILPVTEEHALGVGDLPGIHRDPFDRLLVAQARCEGLTVVTADEFIPRYPVACLW